MNSKRHTSIDDRLRSERSQLVLDNRHYLRSVVEVILLCAKQDFDFRGHKESKESFNRGNFLEILTLVACHDPVVRKKFLGSPRNALYTSVEIQNPLLHIMGEMVRENVCNEVREAGPVSMMKL